MPHKFRVWDSKENIMLYHESLSILIASYEPSDFDNNPDRHVMESIDCYDASHQEIYTGDILRLAVTDELMRTSFAGSNCGKTCAKYDAKEVWLFIDPERTHGNVISTVFMKRQDETNPKATRYITEHDVYDNDEPTPYDFGLDNNTLFLQYLCAKGATVIGNCYQNPDYVPKT